MLKAACLFAALAVTSTVWISPANAQTAPATSTPMSNRSQVFQAPPPRADAAVRNGKDADFLAVRPSRISQGPGGSAVCEFGL